MTVIDLRVDRCTICSCVLNIASSGKERTDKELANIKKHEDWHKKVENIREKNM